MYKNLNYDKDFALALQIQEQYDKEINNRIVARKSDVQNDIQTNYNNNNKVDLGDPSLEVKDPTPNIFNLFVNFNKTYFWGKLNSVAVRWSKRMYSCAGICSYVAKNGFCEIALSEPLLKLRPRKDLVETLLHEMIHAYLFVTNNVTDRDGHGPNFLFHMFRINKATNLDISVYHNFHDEVRLYQNHWWRCNGCCQKQRPYFGFIKRSSNRAPGPNDFWWKQHEMTCGGTFIKVKEPEKVQKPTEKNNNTLKNKENNKNRGNSIGANKSISVTKTPISDKKSTENILSYFKQTDKNQTMASGATLAGTSALNDTTSDSKSVLETVRSSWLKRYSTSNKRPSDSPEETRLNKVIKLENDTVVNSDSIKVKTDDCDSKFNVESNHDKPSTSNNVNNLSSSTYNDSLPSTSKCDDYNDSLPSTSKCDDSYEDKHDKLSLYYSIPPKLLEDCNQIMRPLYGQSFTLNNNHFKLSRTDSDLWLKASEIEGDCKVQCPICCRMFARSKIEEHANICIEHGPSQDDTITNEIDLTMCGGDCNETKDVKPNIKFDTDFVIDLTDNVDYPKTRVVVKPEIKEIKVENTSDEECELDAAKPVDCDNNKDNLIDTDYCHCPLCNVKLNRNDADEHLEQCVAMTFIEEPMIESPEPLSNENQSDRGDDVVEESNANGKKVSCPCCYKLFEEGEINRHLDDCLL